MVTVNNGYYGTNSSTPNTGPFTPATGVPPTIIPLAGENNQPTSTTATNELGNVTSAAGKLVKDVIIAAESSGAQQSLPAVVGNVMTFLPNTYYFVGTGIAFGAGSLSGVTSIAFNTQGNTDAQFFIISGANITFAGITSMNLNVNSVAALPSNIFWLAETASITFTTTPTIYGNIISAAGVTFDATSTSVTGNIFAFNASVTFAGTTTVNGTRGPTPTPIVCFVKGTKILTKDGCTSIEDLQVDDEVITKGKIYKNEKYLNSKIRSEPVYWISKFKVRNLTEESAPICIKASALRENYPFEDLYVSPNHGMIVKGNLVRAKDLVNEETIFQDFDRESVTYYHVELERHSAIIANGILAESYLNCENRFAFENNEKNRKPTKEVDLSKKMVLVKKPINKVLSMIFINKMFVSLYYKKYNINFCKFFIKFL